MADWTPEEVTEEDRHRAFHARSMLPMGSLLCATCNGEQRDEDE